jgi:PadR family transcriptional regulator PadR
MYLFGIHKNQMYICVMYSSELIKGTLKTIVLNLLKDNDKMYGYEITQKVKEMTSDKIQITEGALYPTLHALEKHGDVETEKVYIGKRVRKYYRLTDQGKKTVQERVNELADFMKTMRFLLDLDSSVQNA